MASVPQSSWFCIAIRTNGGDSTIKVSPRNCIFRTPKVSSSSSNAESSSPNPSNSPDKSLEVEPSKMDPVKLAFAKAMAYKKAVKSNPTPKISVNPDSEDDVERNTNDGSVSEVTNSAGNEEVPLSVRLAMEKSKKKNREIIVGSSGIADKSATFSGSTTDGSVSQATNGDNQKVPTSDNLEMEKAKAYLKDKGDRSSGKIVEDTQTISGLNGGNGTSSAKVLFEKMVGKKEDPPVSSIDFMGLDFGDKKKSRGLPPGLVPITETFPEGNIPEVEILVGDTSKFEKARASPPKSTEEDKSDLYKPKISLWGVFPRPSNISKAYGGGRVIHPGEVLETAEDKAAKEARVKELVAAYKSKFGLNIDPKLKSECEKTMKEGNSLMDLGKLKEALPNYQKVMDSLTFESELHGLAALQWSICLDSLCRSSEAQVMYEKLKLHPNADVRKKAKQLLFSFQAMEMMKVKRTTLSPVSTGYQKYFEAFIEDKPNYSVTDPEVGEEGAFPPVGWDWRRAVLVLGRYIHQKRMEPAK